MLLMRSWVLVATPIGEPECAAALYHLHPRPTGGVEEEGWRWAKSGVGRRRFWEGSQRHEAQGLDCARTDLAVVLRQLRAFFILFDLFLFLTRSLPMPSFSAIRPSNFGCVIAFSRAYTSMLRSVGTLCYLWQAAQKCFCLLTWLDEFV